MSSVFYKVIRVHGFKVYYVTNSLMNSEELLTAVASSLLRPLQTVLTVSAEPHVPGTSVNMLQFAKGSADTFLYFNNNLTLSFHRP